MEIKNSCFVKSLKLDRRFVYVSLLDILSFLVLIVLVSSFLAVVRVNWASIEYITPQIKRMSNFMEDQRGDYKNVKGDVNIIYSALKSFAIKSSLLLGIFIALAIFSVSFLKSLGWSIILKEKLKRAFFLKFALLLFIYNLVLFLLFAIIIFGTNPKLNAHILFFTIVLSVYIGIFLYPIFAKRKKVLLTIKETLHITFRKFYLIIAQSLIMLFILYILFQFLFKSTTFQSLLIFFLLLTLIIIYITWIKFYIILLIEKPKLVKA